MANEIPVYLFVGFLESGKTKFIQETFEDPNFDSGDKTLLLVCEEGEEEYNLSLIHIFLPARCAGRKTLSSTCSISSTRKCLSPSARRGTTMCRTLRASATPRSTRPPSCRTNYRCSAITKIFTPGSGCTRRYGPSCTSSSWTLPRAPTPPGLSLIHI